MGRLLSLRAVAVMVSAAAVGAPLVPVVGLGNGMGEAIGIAVGAGDRMVATPASSTFLITMPEGVVVDTSPAAAAPADRHALSASQPVRALLLTAIALAVDPSHRTTFEVWLTILQGLDWQSRNGNERGWLEAGIREIEAQLRR
jgi:hypothetical protein